MSVCVGITFVRLFPQVLVVKVASFLYLYFKKYERERERGGEKKSLIKLNHFVTFS